MEEEPLLNHLRESEGNGIQNFSASARGQALMKVLRSTQVDVKALMQALSGANVAYDILSGAYGG